MLVLSRKVNERICIGDDIEIVLIDIRHGQDRARIGIEAPKEIAVFRKELLDRKGETPHAVATPDTEG